MTVKENAAVGAMYGAGGRKKSARQAIGKAEEILEFVGLADAMNKSADQLSVASRKRLEMAKALTMEPEVVLFDEVMAGLNFSEIDQAVELIMKIRASGVSILVIEHVMRAIKRLCDRIFVLHHGEKIADGPAEIVDHLIDIVKEINQQGTSVLLVEQDVQLALDNSHYGYVLSTGSLAMEGASGDLLQKQEIKEIYLGL